MDRELVSFWQDGIKAALRHTSRLRGFDDSFLCDLENYLTRRSRLTTKQDRALRNILINFNVPMTSKLTMLMRSTDAFVKRGQLSEKIISSMIEDECAVCLETKQLWHRTHHPIHSFCHDCITSVLVSDTVQCPLCRNRW